MISRQKRIKASAKNLYESLYDLCLGFLITRPERKYSLVQIILCKCHLRNFLLILFGGYLESLLVSGMSTTSPNELVIFLSLEG